jgi:hypothetical protein
MVRQSQPKINKIPVNDWLRAAVRLESGLLGCKIVQHFGQFPMLRRFVIFAGLFPTLLGCFGGPSRIEAPKWDVDAITAACMSQADADGNGSISKQEAKDNAPSLAYALQALDANQDNELSEDEVRQRFVDLANAKTGVQGFGAKFTFKGRPLPGGKARLVPEPFLEGVIEPAEGMINEDTGSADFDIPGDDYYGVRPGMYRIEVTSERVKIPAKYNEETVLGIDVSPFTNPFEAAGGPIVRLR